ncbi:hypothetical protein [Calothrix sp. PCC 7507]|uniref:hypothetical protein n=1 Tax=Calothrix sp. PCC 7507 TaxID=99598 RepID=UPI00029F14E5|nr:hypothetical protein [Calothrix sp. PCC 7507]AFY35311.1 hypothetical protein Cal7507_4960 [Calothrix sp. PCC 7507]
MFPQVNHGKPYLRCLGNAASLALLISGIAIAPIHIASAHKVKIGTNVGGTLHIEPNDNPRAGEPAKTWFALTRKGGKVIPLKDCNCQLAVYAEPHTQGEPALLEPTLKPVAAERYQGTPGTEITFPKPGIYQLQLTGKPATRESFQPFEFNFEVTVAAGSSVVNAAQNLQNVNNEQQKSSAQLPFWAIAILILPVIGILFVVLQGRKGGKN